MTTDMKTMIAKYNGTCCACGESIRKGENQAELAKTHWADSDRAAWQEVADIIPGVIETGHRLWSERIERMQQGKPTEHVPHAYLYPITCLRYHRRADGVQAPVEPNQTLSFLVAAQSTREAYGKVSAQLKAHGYGFDEWSIGSSRAPLILC